jgi:hypothetical protein
LKPPAVVGLDDYQRAPPGSGLHEVIREAAETLPAGIGLEVKSRAEPPAAFAR